MMTPKQLTLAVAVLLFAGCDDEPLSPCIDCAGDRPTEVLERSFTTAENPRITVDNFAGSLTFRAGEPGIIHVKATRRAERRSDLAAIGIDMRSHEEGLDIHTENPERHRNSSVDLVITAPPGSTPRIRTAVGDIRYDGRPKGDCLFWTAVGSIRLELPSNVSLSFELRAAVGSIYVDFPLDDVVWTGMGMVTGRIGSGDDAYVIASAAVGSVRLVER